MRAIVTGANGFVGSNLVKKLVKNNIEVLAIDLSFNPSRLEENQLIEKVELSIDSIHSLKDKVNKEYDLFYHFAWVGSAGPLRTNEIIQTNNAVWTVACLKVAHEIGCKKFICAGSIMEFESMSNTYEQEIRPALPNIYSAAKSYAHQLCKPIANNLGIDLIWAYITNAYGVGEKSPRFINSTLRKIIRNEPLEFTSGTQNYDFVYIDDVAKAFYLLGIKGKANKGYMIGSGHAKPLREFIIDICNVTGTKNPPLFGNIEYTGVNLDLNVYSIKELEKDCGFKCEVSFEDGILMTKKWLEVVDYE
ncbi:NAD-dependent epimerase/dehydratase family protein [Pseudobutyrivibrio sp.]|uniref:NAD-dependent epimerase/dehydratase family protein n=1 Tax=Pseudobutyrivibrio sp. TaxID=2014367 RepID=UPI001B7154C4|nr:NAD(P)-dependent oxidoreductase [Pseudobutyrivibrio sp.]MBP3263698.1 NAD(P)-dependent oxidoreductase [Pseudobutyrivibrio sp.]